MIRRIKNIVIELCCFIFGGLGIFFVGVIVVVVSCVVIGVGVVLFIIVGFVVFFMFKIDINS